MTMIALRGLSLAGILIMAFAILVAFATGDFFEEGSTIWALPWGKVGLIGLYVGLFFFGAWIAFREMGGWSTVLRWIALITLGNLAAGAYLAFATCSSENGQEVLLGRKRSSVP
ncbi:MAG TPA: hypothetical protein VIW94_09055 [Acidimicrobiia bacterium]